MAGNGHETWLVGVPKLAMIAPLMSRVVPSGRESAAILQGIRSLRDEDRFAVVACDDKIEVVVPTTPATAEAREAAARAVARIGA